MADHKRPSLFSIQNGIIFLSTIMISTAILLLATKLEQHSVEKNLAEQRLVALSQLSAIRAKLEGDVNGSMALLRGVASYISRNPNATQEEFSSFSSSLINEYPQIRNIGAAPDFVIRLMYPLKGNEKAIGLDYRKTPTQWEPAKRAMDSGKMSLAGPLKLVQGGTGLIGRVPVFEDGVDGKFWGLVSGVIDVPTLYKNAGMSNSELPLNITIKGKDGFGRAGEIFYGNTESVNANPVSLIVSVPNGEWVIFATPTGGWLTNHPESRLYFFASASVVVMLIALAFLMIFNSYRKEKDQQQIEQSEKRYKNLFNSSEISIWNEDFSEVLKDLNRLRHEGVSNLRQHLLNHEHAAWEMAKKIKVLHVNEATLTLFDAKTENEFFARISDTFGPSAIEVFKEQLCAIWEHKKIFRAEAQYRTLTGEIISCILSLPLPETEEGFKSVPVSLINITERKNAEDQLILAKNEAEKANKSKSEFLASMSHELRTPLNAVLGFAQMMQFDPKNPLSSDQRKHTDSILEGGNHLLDLVNEILDLARIEADQLELSIRDVEANEVVADCVNLITPLCDQRKILVSNEFSNGPSELLITDHTRLKQALINLLSNAVKFNRDGGSVTVEGYKTDYGFLRISVTDTGEGIAEEDHDSVFNLFHRLGSNPMVSREGTGIGLTVTKLLVERMAGRVGFDSEFGTGSTFWIELPLASNDDVLIWTNAIKVGVDAIDKDHQELVSLLNRIMRRSIEETGVDEVIEELIDYTHYHFKREEAIMEICEYPNLEGHREHHQVLISQASKQAETWFNDRSQEGLTQFRKFLKGWLFDHILKQDTKIIPYTKGKGHKIRQALALIE